MEDSKATQEFESRQSFKHITLKSTKFKETYELIWSEKFIDHVSNLKNRAIANILKKIKKDDEGSNQRLQFGDKWLLTNKLKKSLKEHEIIDKSNDVQECLFTKINNKAISEEFESRQRFEPSKPKLFILIYRSIDCSAFTPKSL